MARWAISKLADQDTRLVRMPSLILAFARVIMILGWGIRNHHPAVLPYIVVINNEP